MVAQSLDSLGQGTPMKVTSLLTDLFPDPFNTHTDAIHIIAIPKREVELSPLTKDEIDLDHRAFYVLHHFLWAQQPNYDSLIRTVNETVPPLTCPPPDDVDSTMGAETEFRFLQLTLIPNLPAPASMKTRWMGEGSLLIRQEYKILDEFLERNVTSGRVYSATPPVERYTHTLVLGQPGIGK